MRTSKFYIYILFTALIFSTVTSCSTRKDKALNRFWHSLNTKYNGYFNAREILKEAVSGLSTTKKDNYNEIIPVLPYGDKANWQSINYQSDKVVEKAVVAIKKHSMLINGKQRNRWIDDCYLVMGKADFFKLEFDLAVNQLLYVVNNSEKTSTKEEARMWMTVAYTALGEHSEAAISIKRTKKDNIDKKLLWFYHAVAAEHYIQVKDYEKAITELDEAIRNHPKKAMKGRFEFIKGQVFLAEEENQQAYRSFEAALKYRPEYEIEFQALLNMAKTSSDKSTVNLIAQLRKMLKDDKNIDYQDQIYYALATVNIRQNDTTEAIKYYKKSLATSTDNKVQKGMSYLTLADIYFGRQDYIPSQAYYDSAATTLDQNHPKYEEVIRLRDNLSIVVENTYMVKLQDSLQILGRMSDRELEVYVSDYIEKLKEEDKRREEEAELATTIASSTAIAPNQTGAKWYFDNPQTVAFGVATFKKQWGNRPLEDNWRRLSKSSSMAAGGNENDEEFIDPRYDADFYLAQVPRTDSAFQASNELIYESLYNLGEVYYDKIHDYKRSIQSFEELAKRNTQNKHFPLTYYQLYTVSNAAKDETRKKKYRDILVQQYPNSDYAQIVSGKYVNKDEKADPSEPTYQQIYAVYTQGNYTSVINQVNSALVQFPESNIKHRFELLKALSIGKIAPVDTFIVALKNIQTNYAESESALTAKRILESLNAQKEAADTVVIKSEESPYIYDPKAVHFYIVYIPSGSANATEAMNAINGFNDKMFSLSSLSVSNTMLGKSQTLVVRRFENATKAKNYSDLFVKTINLDNFKLINSSSFAISLNNYSVLFKRQDIKEYLEFYDKHYK